EPTNPLLPPRCQQPGRAAPTNPRSQTFPSLSWPAHARPLQKSAAALGFEQMIVFFADALRSDPAKRLGYREASLCNCDPFEVHGDGGKQDGCAVARQSSISCTGEAVDILEQTEERLDRAAVLADGGIAPELRTGEGLVGMSASHNAIL